LALSLAGFALLLGLLGFGTAELLLGLLSAYSTAAYPAANNASAPLGTFGTAGAVIAIGIIKTSFLSPLFGAKPLFRLGAFSAGFFRGTANVGESDIVCGVMGDVM
jgi:hypothetical protein